MTVRSIITYPDESGILRTKCPEVKDVTDLRIQQVVRDLLDTVTHTDHSAGLAAPQIGESFRIVVIMPDEKLDPLVLINPKIIKSKGREEGYEGCLSIPDTYGPVVRATWIKVRAVTTAVRTMEFDAKDLFARIVQHEIDHLEGILFLDRVRDKNRIVTLTRSEIEDTHREELEQLA